MQKGDDGGVMSWANSCSLRDGEDADRKHSFLGIARLVVDRRGDLANIN